LLLVAAAASLALVCAGGAPVSSRALQASLTSPVAQPVIGLPVTGPILIGASPNEEAGETWGYSTHGPQGHEFQIVRYTPSNGWQIQAQPSDEHGNRLEGFKPAPGPLAGRTTANGGVAIVGEDSHGVGQVLARDPNGSFHELPTLTVEPAGATGPPEGGESTKGGGEPTKGGESSKEGGEPGEPSEPSALLKKGETLFASSGEGALMTPVDEEGGHTGVYLVPFESATSGVQEDVLAFEGTRWAREPICMGVPASKEPESCTKPSSGFKVLAIDASSPTSAWLLAKSSGEGVVLLGREGEGAKARWTQRTLGGNLGGEFSKASLSLGEGAASVTVKVAPLGNGQPLTATPKGVWIDGQLTISGQAEPSDFTLFYESEAGSGGQIRASWCDAPGPAHTLCTYPLESELPSGDYRSFAWNTGSGAYGERVITGFPDGVSLSLQGASFAHVLGTGGEAGSSAGAAFSSPQEGWLADSSEGPLTHLTNEPAPDRLQSWPVPFRRPLTALAEQPGASPGELGAQAVAVGDAGQVVHYTPGQGWVPEALLNSSGTAQAPNLRGVAWPEPGRAYAVGTHGAMWLWQEATGLWEPDPAKPPNLVLANFTGIAFAPNNPTRGYAIGQQRVLLGFGKTWTQEALPPGLENADFTSIAFAGEEAMVTYQIPHFKPEEGYGYGFSGGLLVNSGSGWRIETAVSDALGKLQVPERVAGLPDGGAVLAAGGTILERQGPGASWQPAPAGPADGASVALAAFREGGQLRAVDSVAGEPLGGSSPYDVDRVLEQSTPEGQAPVATEPYPLPTSGFLLRETTNGWEDEEHEDYPAPDFERALPQGQTGVDWPDQPDAVLALQLSPDGSQGWAVGGQTGEINNVGLGATQQHVEAIQTAGVMRYPASGTAPAGFASDPEQVGAGTATFAIGGNAQCATACADLAEDQLGPDAWLSNAIDRAAQTPGVRAFLYSGSHLAPDLGRVGGLTAGAFKREEKRYAQLMQSVPKELATFAAPAESDLDQSNSLASFSEAFSVLDAPQGERTPTEAEGIAPISPASSAAAYFSFASNGAAGTVRVIVLDYSSPSLGFTQQCWLAQQLAQANEAEVPAIVVGSRMVSASPETSANPAADSSQVIPTLVNGTPPTGGPTECIVARPAGASAYFYDFPEQNRTFSISAGGASIPTFGSGTLGYVVPPSQTQTEFLGASGFLLAEVQVSLRNPTTNRAPVSAKLVPDISDLALDATNGVLLRRSQPALFTALARRPHAGMLCAKEGAECEFDPDPYVPIPDPCQGANCASGIFPEYTFTSSNPDIGNFVTPDPATPGGTTVLQNAKGEPIPDPHSGLFCALNAGTTTVTVQSGGLSSSEQVTIQAGSVEQPCGTVPLKNPPAPEQRAGLPVPLPAPAPTPSQTPQEPLPLPPSAPHLAPSPVLSTSHVHVHPAPLPAVPLVPAQLFPILPLVPPPPPAAARPTPPSGTAQVPAQSPVSQTVGIEEREEEAQSATESVHHMAAYEHPVNEGPFPPWTLALVLVALAAGMSISRPHLQQARVELKSGPPEQR
jgi:hypothetical protein